MRPFFCFLLCLCIFPIHAQNVLTIQEDAPVTEADISAMKWMTGHWVGKAFGGTAEEIWSPPAAGAMMFVFRLIVDDQVHFYEIGHLRQKDNTLWFELKHFNQDLTGWETKEHVQRFRLIKIEDNRAYFNGFTFERANPNEINIYAHIHNDDGAVEEVTFNYKRQ